VVDSLGKWPDNQTGAVFVMMGVVAFIVCGVTAFYTRFPRDGWRVQLNVEGHMIFPCGTAVSAIR
jgi:hypothetical protein